MTDRCNLRCRYCMPEEGIPTISHDSIMRYEEIALLVRAAASIGFTKVRLTGGEPLVRRGLTDLIKSIAAVEGISDLSLTTNGVLLAEEAARLKAAGIGRINISLDTLEARPIPRHHAARSLRPGDRRDRRGGRRGDGPGQRSTS